MKFAIAAILFSLLTAQSYACSCARLSYGTDDVETAINNFVETKLDGKVVSSKELSRKFTMPGPLKIYLKALRPLIGKSEYECEMMCSQRNQTSEYSVLAMIDGGQCEVQLTVTMKEKIVSDKAFKSIVKSHSVSCNE